MNGGAEYPEGRHGSAGAPRAQGGLGGPRLGPPCRSIAVNASIVGDRPTGLGLYALHLIRELDALGERLVVYTSRPDAIRAPGARVERIKRLVESVPGVSGEIFIPEGGNRYPTLRVLWDEKAFHLTVAQCDEKLRQGEPRIEVLTNSNPSLVSAVHEGDPKGPRHEEPNRLEIISSTLEAGEDLIVGKRLRDILNEARKNA